MFCLLPYLYHCLLPFIYASRVHHSLFLYLWVCFFLSKDDQPDLPCKYDLLYSDLFWFLKFRNPNLGFCLSMLSNTGHQLVLAWKKVNCHRSTATVQKLSTGLLGYKGNISQFGFYLCPFSLAQRGKVISKNQLLLSTQAPDFIMCLGFKFSGLTITCI